MARKRKIRRYSDKLSLDDWSSIVIILLFAAFLIYIVRVG